MSTLPLQTASVITVQAAVDQFLASIQYSRLELNTLLWYRYELGRLSRQSGVSPLNAIPAEEVGRWPYTASFGQAVRRLFNWHRIEPPREFEVPPCGQRQRIVTTWEFRRMMRHCPIPTRRLLYALWVTGARPQELRELRWRDVFEADRVVRLEKFKAKKKRKDQLQVRHITLSRALAGILCRRRDRQRPLPTDHVFINCNGQPWTKSALRQAVRKATRRAGLDPIGAGERIVAYSLRHSFATRAAQARASDGVTPRITDTELADLMGHTDLDTTRRYLHRSAADLVNARDRAMSRKRRAKKPA